VTLRRGAPAAPRWARRSAALPVAGILAGAGLAGVAGLQLSSAQRSPDIDAGTVPLAGHVALLAPVPAASPGPTPAPLARAGGIPRRLQLPAERIDAAVVPVQVSPRGELGVPFDVTRLGWWASGPLPGTPIGTVVLDGHVDDRTGPGALFRLARTPLGSPLWLDTTSGPVRYQVRARRLYDKNQLPGDLFTVDGPGRLVLITCGGPFDSATGHYQDNVVLFAVPVPTAH